MKPVIAITCAYDDVTDRAMIHMGYVRAVEKAGGIPLMIYSDTFKCDIPNADGVILSGGGDIVPMIFGQKPHEKIGKCQYERDLFELRVIEKYKNLPILGICRGMQIINVAFDGDILQDMQGHDLKINERHGVKIYKNTRLYDWVLESDLRVNSLHHQVVDKIGRDFIINAVSEDGYVEGIEHRSKKIIGVQWHPEKMGNDRSEMLFKGFVNWCKQ